MSESLALPDWPIVTRHQGFDLGIMVSASHNPYQDNGIKIFGQEWFQAYGCAGTGDRAADRGTPGTAS